MSTKVAVIAEGPIDFVLLSPLLAQISQKKAQFRWPVLPDDMAEILPIRKRGHGGVLEKVRALIKFLNHDPLGYDLFVILLDRRTQAVQSEIKKLIRGKQRFVFGIAIEEIEAWWLGDRTNTLAWSGFTNSLPTGCRYEVACYHAETDRRPKKTLDELTRLSERFDRVYGDGDMELAQQFANDHWVRNASLGEIASQCSQGFGKFQEKMINAFRAAKARTGRLF